MNDIRFETVEHIEVSELAEFYERQGHRTTTSPEKLERMVEQCFCFVTARQGSRLVGVAHGLTDGIRGYLAECKLVPELQGPAAVTRQDGRVEHDREGIARTMASRVIDALRDSGVEEIHVLAYGTEVDFCEDLGFKKVGGMVALRLDVEAEAPVATGAAS